MDGAVAGGHPLTAEAGARVLAAGGNAVDACVAAAFVSWVVESPLTGPGGGGFMLVHPGNGRPARLLDFFVAVPGLGPPPRRRPEMEVVDVPFEGEGASQVFRIGAASCAVPGTALGLEAAHRAYGSLPWERLVAPAAELARGGFELGAPQAYLHAILDVILRHEPEGRRVYSRDGALLRRGDRLALPDLAATLEAIAGGGARVLYDGELGERVCEHVRAGGGELRLDDLRAYRVVARRPIVAAYRGHEYVSNPPPSSGGVLVAYALALLDRLGEGGPPGSAEAVGVLAEVMREGARARETSFASALHRGGLARRLLAEPVLAAAAERVRAGLPAPVEAAPPGGTTHISVLDRRGAAASLSASIGSGSGVVVPGTGVHLNNMLGEYDLAPAGAGARPGRRLTSMMAPSVVVGPAGPRLVVGSAGSVRLRAAILQAVVNVVGHGLGAREALERPRVHVDGPHLHCEGGFDAAELDRLAAWGYDVVRWRRRNLYFGGASAVERRADGRLAAAGDPRRGGHGIVVA